MRRGASKRDTRDIDYAEPTCFERFVLPTEIPDCLLRTLLPGCLRVSTGSPQSWDRLSWVRWNNARSSVLFAKSAGTTLCLFTVCERRKVVKLRPLGWVCCWKSFFVLRKRYESVATTLSSLLRTYYLSLTKTFIKIYKIRSHTLHFDSFKLILTSCTVLRTSHYSLPPFWTVYYRRNLRSTSNPSRTTVA